MNAFLYSERSSFLNRLNPLTKLGVAIALLALLTAVGDPTTELALTLASLGALVLLGRVSIATLARIVVPTAILGIGFVWTTAFFYVADDSAQPRTIVAWGTFVLSEEGLAYALTVFLRLQGFLAASLLFVLTTDPTDFVLSLIQRLGLSYRFGYGTLAAYHFVPKLQSDLATIRAAHRIRGVEEGRGPLAATRRYVGYLIPLLAGAVRRADRVALAMDARAFGAFPTRTYYRRPAFHRGDVVFGIGSLLALAGLLATLHALGWLGTPIPPFIR